MRALAAIGFTAVVAAAVALPGCPGGTGWRPVDGGFGVPGVTGSGSSGGSAGGGTSGGASGSSGGTSGGFSTCGGEGTVCAPDGGADGGGLCCGGACLDPSADPANCGGCGVICASGDFCDLGSCTPTPTCGLGTLGAPCPLDGGGLGACCGGGCAATAVDPANCGACGAVCPIGASCAAGGCVAAGGGAASCLGAAGACPLGTACTGAACVAIACADDGGGALCLFGASASAGIRVGVCCGSGCSDISQDPSNCNGCGLSCTSGVCDPANAQCLPPPGTDGGSCVCPTGQACAGSVCADTGACQSLADLCFVSGNGDVGACCPGVAGALACADLAADPANCGACGAVCPAGQVCTAGVCDASRGACGAGTIGKYCDLDAGPSWLCCPGRNCTNVLGDDLDCGGCSRACDGGTSCIDGRCVATACSPATQGDACLLADGGDGACCNSLCLDVSADPSNCGGCQTSCTGAESCRGGSCAYDACTTNLFNAPCHLDGGLGNCCGTGCADLQADPANCGACGDACADAGCLAGSCA